MGYLFRKRIKLLPGLWLNLSKRGISTSFADSGFSVNIKDEETGTTAPITDVGQNYGTTTRAPYDPASRRVPLSKWFWLLLIAVAGITLLAL